MLLPSHITSAFESGHTFLVCTARQAWLARADATFYPVGGSGDGPAVVIDLAEFWETFVTLTKDQSAFTKKQVMQVAAIDADTFELWKLDGILQPVASRVGSYDCFAAALCGCLRRHGVPHRVARRAAFFVTRGEGVATR